MKVGYAKGKKGKRKGAKGGKLKAAQQPEGSATAADAADAPMEVDGAAGNAAPALTSKAKRRREVAERKSLKAKLQTLKKTKLSVRKGVARGLQGATNQTHNQLNQDIMKLAQEHERLGGKAAKKKKKGKAGKAKAQSWEAAAMQAIAEHADVEMAA